MLIHILITAIIAASEEIDTRKKIKKNRQKQQQRIERMRKEFAELEAARNKKY